MRREVQLKLRTIRTSCMKSRVHRPARVNDQQITSPEKIPDITEPRMHHAIIRAVRDHQPHLVACQPPRFRRLTCPKLWRQIEVQHLSPWYTRTYKPERQRFCINHNYLTFGMGSRLIRIIVGATLVVAQACWLEIALEPIGVIAPRPWQ